MAQRTAHNRQAQSHRARRPLPGDGSVTRQQLHYAARLTMLHGPIHRRGPLPGEVHQRTRHEGRARQDRRALWNPSQSRQADDPALPEANEGATEAEVAEVTEAEDDVEVTGAGGDRRARSIAAIAPGSSGT